MKKKNVIILAIAMIIVIAGVIVASTIGFNKQLRYQDSQKIDIYVASEVDVDKIKSIANEVLGKQNMVQTIEIYQDMVTIRAKSISDEQKDSIVNKIKENYEFEQTAEKTEIKDIKLVGQATWKDKISGKDISDNVFIVEKEIIETDENGKERVTEQKSYYLGNRCVAGTLGNDEIVYSKSFAESEIDKQKAINDLIDKISEKEIEKKKSLIWKETSVGCTLTAESCRKQPEVMCHCWNEWPFLASIPTTWMSFSVSE